MNLLLLVTIVVSMVSIQAVDTTLEQTTHTTQKGDTITLRPIGEDDKAFFTTLHTSPLVRQHYADGQPAKKDIIDFMFERGVARAQHTDPRALRIISMQIHDKMVPIGAAVAGNATQSDALEVAIVMHPCYGPATQTYPHCLSDDTNGYTMIWNRGIATTVMDWLLKTGFNKAPDLIPEYTWQDTSGTTHMESTFRKADITSIIATASEKNASATLLNKTFQPSKNDTQIGSVQKSYYTHKITQNKESE